eukprot:jgi/Mesen1/10677/ME000009S10468
MIRNVDDEAPPALRDRVQSARVVGPLEHRGDDIWQQPAQAQGTCQQLSGKTCSKLFLGTLHGAALYRQLAATNAELEAYLGQLQRQLEEVMESVERKERALDAALADVERAQEGSLNIVYLLDPAGAPHLRYDALLHPHVVGLGEAARKNVQVANLSALVQARVGPTLKAQVAQCFKQRCACNALQEELVFGVSSSLVLIGVAKLNELHPWFVGEKMSVEEATRSVAAHPNVAYDSCAVAVLIACRAAGVDDERGTHRRGEQKLRLYVKSHTLYGKYWKPEESGESVARVRAWKDEQGRRTEQLFQARMRLGREVDSCNRGLQERCGLELPRATWQEEAKARARNQSEEEIATRMAPVCLAARGKKREERAAGLSAPPDAWRWDASRYLPRVNVSFVVQLSAGAARRPPASASLLVDRLYQCTRGHLAQGQLLRQQNLSLSSEMIVNVDDARDWRPWAELWNKTREGAFLTPVFSHNLHEARGLNRGAAVARGDIIVLIQGNEVPPPDCSWVGNLAKMFDSWPRLGMVGLKGGKFTSANLPHYQSELAPERRSDDAKWMRHVDPVSGVNMRFVGLVDLGPIAFRRAAFAEIGGLDEGLSKPGEPAVWTDWHVALRMWLAGYQVAQMHMVTAFTELGDKEDGAAEGAAGGSEEGLVEAAAEFVREQNDVINMMVYKEFVQPYEQLVLGEVKRLNRFLTNRDPYE